jgi:hypothetical protein
MTTAKCTWIQERSRIYAIVVQDLMKRGVCRCWVKMPLGPLTFPRSADQALQQFMPLEGGIPKMQAYPQLIPREQALISGTPPPREITLHKKAL